jgi:hypothetical protein
MSHDSDLTGSESVYANIEKWWLPANLRLLSLLYFSKPVQTGHDSRYFVLANYVLVDYLPYYVAILSGACEAYNRQLWKVCFLTEKHSF